MEGFYRKSFQVTSDWPDSSSEISSFLVWNRVRRRYCIKSHLCLVLHSLLIISVAMIRRKMLVKKDVCHLVTSMGQRKKFPEESKSKSPWGIEPQTFRFRALMLYHWATVSEVYHKVHMTCVQHTARISTFGFCAPMLYTEPQRLHSEQGLLQSSYDTSPAYC